MTRVMSEAQREAVDHWVRGALPVLLLGDWLVEVEHDPPLDDADAQIETVGDSMRARMRVSAELFVRPTMEQRHVLIHELCHLHVWALDQTVSSLVDGKDHLAEVIERQVHVLVDQVARLLNESGLGLPSMGAMERAVPLETV